MLSRGVLNGLWMVALCWRDRWNYGVLYIYIFFVLPADVSLICSEEFDEITCLFRERISILVYFFLVISVGCALRLLLNRFVDRGFLCCRIVWGMPCVRSTPL